MRWLPKDKVYPEAGDTRERVSFLLLPRRDELTGEWRWLEWARYVEVWDYKSHNDDGTRYGWCVAEWLP